MSQEGRSPGRTRSLPSLQLPPPPRMLRQLTTCVSDDSCAVDFAFDFDCDDEEIYVIDDDEEGDDDEFCINDDGAYWKTPGGHPLCTTFYKEEEEEDINWDNYDHETLTTRFSRQTSATLESILGNNSSILSPSANFIIEDLHLLEQTNHQTGDVDNNAHKKKRSTLAKFQGLRSPTVSPLQQQPSQHPLAIQALPLVQAVVTAGHHSPLPLHQKLKSQSSPTFSPNIAGSNDTVIPQQQQQNAHANSTTRRWSNLSPTVFGSKSQSPTFFGSKNPSPKTPPTRNSSLLLPRVVESSGDDTMSKRSKNTHPSTSTTTMKSLSSSLTASSNMNNESSSLGDCQWSTRLELTLSGSIMEEEEEEEEDEEQSEIIRLDSIVSSPSSLFFSLPDEDTVVLEKRNKRKRIWTKFCTKVAAWKRIAIFHCFPHRRTYTRFEI